jgi:hypothetical protein
MVKVSSVHVPLSGPLPTAALVPTRAGAAMIDVPLVPPQLVQAPAAKDQPPWMVRVAAGSNTDSS